jgi:uncharacterized protein YeaO (DUF488 family)
MKIYTSYFANLKNLEEAGIYPVGICCKVPSFFKGPNLESVAPSKSILFEHKENPDEERYEQRYINEILCAYRFHPEYLIERLESFNNGGDVALCCYEKPSEFCHRHILAKWLNEKIPGLNIEEYPIYPKPGPAKRPKKEDDYPKSNALF